MEETSSFLGNFLHQKRLHILKQILSKLDHNYSVLDMGCGCGMTMTTFKESGFNNITGIDFAEESIARCEEKGFVYGRDVFLSDAKHTSFHDSQFDIVFSEGLWEHFQDPRPHIAEAARLSKQYIIVFQPDHFSLTGYFMNLGWNIFTKNKGGVHEYSFHLSYFKQFLKLYGFDLIKTYSTPLHEWGIMVFKKHNIWLTAQQHELNYIRTKESQIWHMHSLEYWKKILNLEQIEGQGIEIGCGNNGLYNFTPNILGIDTINFHKPNFIQATGEHLPIKQVDFAILFNSLDHTSNPEQVLNEVSTTTINIILWTYIHPKLISFLLSKLDKMHPYHFTKTDLRKLTQNFTKTKEISYSSFILWKYAQTKTAKIKLLIMYLLNIHAVCIHLSTLPQEYKW